MIEVAIAAQNTNAKYHNSLSHYHNRIAIQFFLHAHGCNLKTLYYVLNVSALIQMSLLYTHTHLH